MLMLRFHIMKEAGVDVGCRRVRNSLLPSRRDSCTLGKLKRVNLLSATSRPVSDGPFGASIVSRASLLHGDGNTLLEKEWLRRLGVDKQVRQDRNADGLIQTQNASSKQRQNRESQIGVTTVPGSRQCEGGVGKHS